MSDYIHFRPLDLNKTIFASRLIAFFPAEGFAIFEGYCRVGKADLPYEVSIYRDQPMVWMAAMFRVIVTDIYKKDIQPLEKESVACNCEPSDCGPSECGPGECDCNIQFFPSDIIILKFYILEQFNEWPQLTWNFSIDNRFTSAKTLLDRYMSLLELPEDQFEPYMSRKEDADFYKGYHALIAADNEDIFRHQYKLVGRPKKGGGVDLRILDMLSEWNKMNRLVTRYIDKDYGNKAFLANAMKFLEWLQEGVPFLHKWCADFLCNETLEDKLRGWLTYGVTIGSHAYACDSVCGYITKKPVPVEFEKHWQLFFRKSDDDADIITLNDLEFDISFKHYGKLMTDMAAECSISRCDDPDILDIHKDLPCNGGLMCILCEEQQEQWIKIVTKRFKSLRNIFINKECFAEFIKLWICAVKGMSDKEQESIKYCWPPVRMHTIHERWRSAETTLYVDECISQLLKYREDLYYKYKTRPKVEFELIQDFQRIFEEYKIPYNALGEGGNRYNEIFLFLTNILPKLSYMLAADLQRCKELTDIFAVLPDE